MSVSRDKFKLDGVRTVHSLEMIGADALNHHLAIRNPKSVDCDTFIH